MTARDQILQSLSAVQPKGKALPDPIQPQSERSIDELWAIFEERLKAVGGKMATVEELARWIQGDVLVEKGIDLCALPLKGRVGERSEPVRGELEADPWTTDFSITTAKVAIAESGTVLLETSPDKPRLSSLAPPRHIVLIDRAKIVERLEEAMPHVSERTSVFITGPSRTADIEGSLVHGVHGPKELIVVLI